MSQFVSKVVSVVNAVGDVADAVASVPPGEVKNEVGLVLAAASALGALHVANAPAAADAVTALVFAAAAVGVAVERVVKAFVSK